MIRSMRVLMVCLFLITSIAYAAELSPGTYRCSSYNVSGSGGSCRNFQPLILNADGTYKYSSVSGSWSVEDGKLKLSKSTFWGAGQILGSDTVRFEYDYRGWHHTITWICGECRHAQIKSSQEGVSARASYIGVTLKLEFGEPVGGVSTYTIVPAESAKSYGHNAPLPEGAVQGVAWESGRTTVSLATNRNNKLMGGKRYVVFLSWPRETIPVAILDLPAQKNDYTGTLPATLNGDQVLRQIR